MIKGTLSRKFRKEKDMTKHILTKHILMALAMAAMVPAGQAWAEGIDDWNPTVQGSKLIIQNATGTVMSNCTYQGKPLSEFETVEIHFNALGPKVRPVGVYSAQYDLTNTNVIVYTKGNESNNDALHFTNHYPHFNAKSLTIYADAKGSDAVNLSRDITTDTSVNISGDLTAVVKDGNGIRANASVNGDYLASITVGGKTDITIQADAGNLFSAYTNGTAINPTAIWAGSDANSLTVNPPQKAQGRGEINLNGKTTITLNGNGLSGDGLGAFLGNGQVYGISAGKNGSIQVNDVEITANGSYSYGISASNVNITYNSDNTENRYGSIVTLNGDANVITMKGDNSYAIYAEGVDAKGNSNTVQSGESGIGSFAITGDIAAENGGNITLEAIKENNLTDKDGNLIGNRGSLTGNILASGKNGEKKSTVDLYVNDTFSMTGNAEAKAGGTVNLTADDYGSLTGSLTADGTGSSVAFSTDQIFDMTGDASATTGGNVALTAGTYGGLTGNLTADGDGSSASLKGDTFDMTGNASATAGGHVTLTSERYGSLSGALTASGESSLASMTSKGENHVDSETVIPGAGGLGTDAPKINSALYAEDSGKINLEGSFNYIAAGYSGEGSENYSRRAVWAYDTADINITGGVQIAADDSAQDDPAGKNSTNMAIVAGTSTNVTSGNVNNEISNRATVTVNYDSYADSDGNTVVNSIKGDIVSAYAGQVDIRKKDDNAKNAKINITGNLLAGNNGILNVDLGNGGTLTGRADDYGDAGVITDSGHTTFFDPAFSSTIYKGGAVNLKMGAGSTWNVTGQSWITSITTADSGSTPVIDLVSANTDRNKTAHALTIYKMDGDAVFNMSLDGDRNVSDMLYMKKADGNYIINVVDPVTLDDMYAKRENGELFNGLRFATVGDGSNVTFRAVTVDKGVLNVEYEVGMDSYDGNDENGEYNSTAEDGTSGNAEKPGNAMVDGFFESDKEPVGSSDNTASSADYMTLSETGTEEDSGTDTRTDAVNYKLMGRADEQISSAGKAIVAMSKVNYSNAVYMDRLNKRMGEARYIDGDDGLWVRLRHDRIGKEDAFRSMNTMFELGYDRKVQDQKDGEHRRGVAFDYMRGEANYTNVMGSGDVRRAGVWLYDTWLGDKGHYSDYMLKYGHLSNDFDIFAPTTADKISGDYDNDVWSASAEYGRKKDIGNDWYFEPQAQLQYAYVTSADYTTSQNTKVSLDGIDSLIGRAGFRLGRDTSEGNTVYFKADILHEFLGDQRVHASDITGALDTTYDNEGTWYDVGFGFSHRMGEDSYMFLDVEHSFGNDNEDTYQINIGLNRAF